MKLLRSAAFHPALGLGLLLWLTTPSLLNAQGLPSGSGAGYGTGAEAGGFGATGTGTESGGLGATMGRPQRYPPILNLEQPFGSGPRPDPTLLPRRMTPGSVEGIFGGKDPLLVREALSISDPSERSLALVRIARTSIFLARPDLGHIAIFQAARDSAMGPRGTLRDQRLMNVIEGALRLADEHIREIAVAQAGADTVGGLPPAINVSREANLERARQEWQLAYEVCFLIDNHSGRTETLYRVVEGESHGSWTLVQEVVRLSGGRPEAAKMPTSTREFADKLLETSIEHALSIDRPTWRDRSLVAVATNASGSAQYDRALEAARSIPQPEVRTDALLKIAENESISGHQKDATKTYQETAQTIAMVPLQDPRETLVGVLIDSLISFGRFDDARASVVLYTNPANPPIALAAVAESQGRRGLADSARQWISQEPAGELRSMLYRRLNDGVLYAVEQKRASELNAPNTR